jgi:hypothetical protein
MGGRKLTRIITAKRITEAMLTHLQWKIGLKLWLDTFNNKNGQIPTRFSVGAWRYHHFVLGFSGGFLSAYSRRACRSWLENL